MNRRMMLAAVICSIFFVAEAWAGECSEYLVKAMREKGLSQDEIHAICNRAEQYAHAKSSIFTPEKIKHDLEDRSLGPDVLVKATTGKTGRSGSASRPSGDSEDDSYSVYVPIPAGETFDKASIRQIKVLQVNTAGNKATVIAYVKTVSRSEGKLRLRYEYVADEWILQHIENLSFKEY
jgi:hypothetical protein